MTNEKRDEFGGLCEMLPWYVNGTLNDIEIQAIEKHLPNCKACASELPVLMSLQKSLGKETVAVLAPAPNVEKFLTQLDNPFVRRFPSRATWIAGALAAGVAVIAVALNGFFTLKNTDSTPYHTATSVDSSASFDYVLHLSLDQRVDADAHLGILQTLEPASIAGLESVGDYRLVVRLEAGSVEDLERYRQDIESRSAISKVSIVAIELPMEAKIDANEN